MNRSQNRFNLTDLFQRQKCVHTQHFKYNLSFILNLYISGFFFQYFALNRQIQRLLYKQYNLLINSMNDHLSSDRLIAHHRSRQDYVTSPQNSLQFGYGDHRYTKFTYQLLNQSDILKQKILKEIIQDFSLCDNIDMCLISSDLLSVLLKHINNTNDTIRILSAKAIKKVCASPLGQKHIVKRDCIEGIQNLVNDPIQQIREDAYQALLNFAEYTDGINCLLQSANILPHLVDKLIQEKSDKILNKTVEILKVLMQGQQGIPKALKTAIISRLMNLISHKFQKIRYNVCMTLANISFNYDGKEQIVQKGHIKQISGYIQDKDELVRESSMLLLCSLAQLNQGKIQIIEFCNFDDIISLLEDRSPTVLNTVQLIGSLAENPKGRQISTPYISKIDRISCIDRIYIDATLEVIKWKP